MSPAAPVGRSSYRACWRPAERNVAGPEQRRRRVGLSPGAVICRFGGIKRHGWLLGFILRSAERSFETAP
jgi:hypothetical protein